MKTKQMVLCGVFAAITAIVAPLAIPIGPIPITLGVVLALLCGGLLKPKLAFVSQIIYILLGCIGLPIFAGFKAGFQVVVGPTGGYLIMYPIMALIVAIALKFYESRFEADKSTVSKSKFIKPLWIFVWMLVAIAVCYVAGSVWFSVQAGVPYIKALMITVVPFIIGDIIKAIIATVLTILMRSRIAKFS
ncbi:MAG: biotin transporter BioY [Oscillospiraceae bacterium]